MGLLLTVARVSAEGAFWQPTMPAVMIATETAVAKDWLAFDFRTEDKRTEDKREISRLALLTAQSQAFRINPRA